MARLDAVESDNESVKAIPRSKRKSATNSSPQMRKVSIEVDEVEEVEPAEVPADSEPASDGEEDEEEYEIEAILDAKKGAFSQGRTGYFVKWKGYGEAENSWVDEKDAGNATDLIDEYWRKVKKEKQSGRKSLDPKPKTRRKSAPTVREDTSEVSQAKKRGRPAAKANKELAESEGDEAPVSKKSRKSNGLKAATKAQQDDREETPPVGNMERFMSIPSWDNMIDTVDTVERDGDELMVYFTLKKDKEHVATTSKVCHEKFPGKMLEFYESNLRWKTEDETAMMEAS